MTKKILGIDQATNLGWNVLEDEELLAKGKYTATSKQWEGKISQIRNFVDMLIEQYEPDIVGIEEVQRQTNTKTYEKLAGLKWALASYLYERGIEYYIIPSSSWKSTCGIKKEGRAREKKASQKHVEKIFGIKVSEDVADSINISYHIKKKVLDK